MYPDDYKVQTMRIIKFERDYKQQLEYQFINAFPKLITAIPVSYGQADILKVSVSFNYDRYIVNPKGNIRYNEQTKITREELSLNPVRTTQREEEQLNNSDRPVSEQFSTGLI